MYKSNTSGVSVWSIGCCCFWLTLTIRRFDSISNQVSLWSKQLVIDILIRYFFSFCDYLINFCWSLKNVMLKIILNLLSVNLLLKIDVNILSFCWFKSIEDVLFWWRFGFYFFEYYFYEFGFMLSEYYFLHWS